MGRRALSPGEHGEIDATPQRRDESGKWKRAANVRSAERWRARAYFRGNNGVQDDLSRVAKTKREAIRAVEAALTERLSSTHDEIRPSTGLATVGEVWLQQMRHTDSGLSQSTVAYYSGTFHRHVVSPESSVRGLTLEQANNPQRLRKHLQEVADRSGSATAKSVKSVLSNLLNFAVENGVLTMNAARLVRPVKCQAPRTTRRDHRRALTHDERQAVLLHADKLAIDETLDPRSRRKREAVADLVAFMAGTGVRIGEARGLRWEHVHLDEGFVRLHGTKSKAARRRLDLPTWLAERLLKRVEQMSEHYRSAAQHAKRSDAQDRNAVVTRLLGFAESTGTKGFVFASPAKLDPEQLWDQSNSSNAVRAVLDGAGLTWAVPHSFRRTVATMLGEAGRPLAQIADQLGHADPSMTASVYLARDFEGDKSSLAELL